MHCPFSRNFRRLVQSMFLVKQSAICAAEWTHFTTIPSLIRSLMIKASNMTLCSWHCGTLVFWIKSYKLLQSTTAYASGDWARYFSGFFHSSDGFSSHDQWILSQDKRSTDPLSAYVSDAKVLPTTLAIFREYHRSGLISLDCHSPMCLDEAKIKHPFCDCELAHWQMKHQKRKQT